MVKNLIKRRKAEELPARRNEEVHPFELLHREIDELFDGFFESFGKSTGWSALRSWGGPLGVTPSFEVSETDDEVLVKAELPGLDEADIEVSIDENVLTIRGEKKDEREEKKRSYHLSEVSYGKFVRSVPLPSGVDRDKVKAKFKKGVLKVSLPKTEQAKTERRKIEISAE